MNPTLSPSPAASGSDLLGTALTADESTLLGLYLSLKTLCGSPSLAPCVASNSRVALAAMAVALTDLGIEFEPLTDLNC